MADNGEIEMGCVETLSVSCDRLTFTEWRDSTSAVSQQSEEFRLILK